MAMSNNHVSVVIDDNSWAKVAIVSEVQCSKVLDLICCYLRDNGLRAGNDLQTADKPLSATVVLSNAEEIRKLNAEFRNQDKPTNVLSFANIDADDFEQIVEQDEVIALGDIIMAWEVLVDEAKQKEIAVEHHFMHLLIHGMLHLLGFDHQNDDEAEVMEGIEIAVLGLMNIDNPYKECE